MCVQIAYRRKNIYRIVLIPSECVPFVVINNSVNSCGDWIMLSDSS